MTLTLYPDQQEVLAKLRVAMTKNKNILLQAATGFGKTRVAQYMVQSAFEKGHGVVFGVPRRQLMEQTSETFESGGLNHSFISAGKMYNPFSRLWIGTTDTMANRLDRLPAAKLFIVDETHYGESSLAKVIDHYKATGAWIVGLSATPWKLSGKGLGCYYDEMVCGPSMRWLIDNKRLSDYRFFAGRTKLDFSKARVSNGEFNQNDLDGIIEANEGKIIGDSISDYKEKAYGKRHVVRCVSIKRSQILAEAYRDAGITAFHVDGTTDRNELFRAMVAYARREIKVLTFCDLLNFGWDLSQASGGMDACVESGDDQKPSKSLAGMMQFWGRMLRAKPESALIFDRVNNWVEHGFPADDRDWTLEDRAQGKKTTGRASPSKQCDNCLYIGNPFIVCPDCGHVHEVKSRKIEYIEGELVELTKEQREELRQRSIKERKQAQGRAETLEDLIALGKSKGYKNATGWAAKVMAGRMAKRGTR